MPTSDLSTVKVGDLVSVSSVLAEDSQSAYVDTVTHVLPSIHVAKNLYPFDPVTGRERRKGAARWKIAIATPEQIAASADRRERLTLGASIHLWLSKAESKDSPIPIEKLRTIAAMIAEA